MYDGIAVLEDIAVLVEERNCIAVDNGLPTIGARMKNQFGIECLVHGHIYLPDLTSLARDNGNVGLPKRGKATARFQRLPVKTLIKFIGSFLAGALGGFFCGLIIITFGNFIGRSGSTGTEYLGYWDLPSSVFFATVYALPAGTVLTPCCFLLFLRKVPLDEAVITCFCMTIGSGCVGALMDPLIAAVTACTGFVICCMYLSGKHGYDDGRGS